MKCFHMVLNSPVSHAYKCQNENSSSNKIYINWVFDSVRLESKTVKGKRVKHVKRPEMLKVVKNNISVTILFS